MQWRHMKDSSSLSDLVKKNVKVLENPHYTKEDFGYISTGIQKVDNVINGFKKGSLTLIGGSNGTGKTRFLYQLCLNIANTAKDELVVLYTTDRIQDASLKLISIDSKIHVSKAINKNYQDDDLRNLANTFQKLSDKNILISNLNGKTASDIRKELESLTEQGLKIKLVAIDNLQLIIPDKSPEDVVDYLVTSRTLKSMSVQFDAPFLLNTDLNRKISQRPCKRPGLDDIHYYSGAVNFSNLILFLYVDEVFYPDTKEPGVLELIVAKNTDGDVATIKLTTNFEALKLRDF